MKSGGWRACVPCDQKAKSIELIESAEFPVTVEAVSP